MGQKGDKGTNKLLKNILIVLMIFVFLTVTYYIIIARTIQTLLTALRDFFAELLDALSDPGGWIKSQWANLKNWFSKNKDSLNADSKFDPTAYEKEGRIEPTFVIDKSAFESIKESLDEIIPRDMIGLDNMMLKKMILTYYKSFYTPETKILIELTKEDFNMNEYEWKNSFVKKNVKDYARILTTASVSVVAGAGVGVAAGAILSRTNRIGSWNWYCTCGNGLYCCRYNRK